MARTLEEIKVADEVWIAIAVLHRKYPQRADFSLEEIVESARREGISTKLRPGVYVHAVQHCVANRPPKPGRYRMLLETAPGRRRLWRPGDRADPRRDGGKTMPARSDIPSDYHDLLDWYDTRYLGLSRRHGTTDPILRLRGLGKKIWGEKPDEYVRRLREGWR